DGNLTRYSDQYSLAIVFQELLTGQRPFQGNNVRQLILQHLQGVPNVSPLPEADRPHVARALSKVPQERCPTCKDLVDALRAPGSPGSRPGTAPRPGEAANARATRSPRATGWAPPWRAGCTRRARTRRILLPSP